ncbi:MAG: bile acid:sodium symporter [Zoogloea sp.]|nr:bile acid:sodium symporter [Zoogloea sp.]
MATSVTPTLACRASKDSTRRRLPPDLALGFCYLCALPSTISSSVALTGLARGNVPAAIFNATCPACRALSSRCCRWASWRAA